MIIGILQMRLEYVVLMSKRLSPHTISVIGLDHNCPIWLGIDNQEDFHFMFQNRS